MFITKRRSGSRIVVRTLPLNFKPSNCDKKEGKEFGFSTGLLKPKIN